MHALRWMLVLLLLLPAPAVEPGPDLRHELWDRILKEYVNEQHRVDYARLKQTGLNLLDRYLEQLAAKWPEGMSEAARKAALINAYNALTIRWVIRHYPVRSIWQTTRPFTAARHRLDGQSVSLDDIETKLRRTGDPHVHSVLVCAARSCPPLRREAYVAGRLDQQMKDNTRQWLSMPALNEFRPEERRAVVSSIFRWYRGDFEQGGMTLGTFLAQFGPPAAAFLAGGDAKIQFKDYDWGLNDAAGGGSNYSRLRLFWDYFRSKW